MKRSEFIGQEHIRHEAEIRDINTFFDYIESYDLKTGMHWPLPYPGGDIVYCTRIDHNNLTIEYTHKAETIVTDMNLFRLHVKDLP